MSFLGEHIRSYFKSLTDDINRIEHVVSDSADSDESIANGLTLLKGAKKHILDAEKLFVSAKENSKTQLDERLREFNKKR